MSILQSIQLFTALNLGAIGLSHFLQPDIWVKFFKYLHSKGSTGNIFNALMALGTGSIIFSLHFVWSWPWVLVTLYGLALMMKGTIYLTFPSAGLAAIGSSAAKSRNNFKWVGLIMSLLSAMIVFGLLTEVPV